MTTGYYVTLRREANGETRTAWLLGPFATHEEALDLVVDGARKAEEIDPRCVWDARGTASITRDADLPTFPRGRLNAEFGIA